VEKEGERFLYSSDLVKIRPRFHRLLKDLDLVITEGSFIRSKGLIRKDKKTGLPIGHNGIPDLVGFFRRYTKRIVKPDTLSISISPLAGGNFRASSLPEDER
jgi:hypothetical protein